MQHAGVTNFTSVGLKVGANRVVTENRLSHPCGNPALDPADERAWRLDFVRRALNALRMPVEQPTLCGPGEARS